jgi:RNA polymerase sigma factor (sigma-70 family)
MDDRDVVGAITTGDPAGLAAAYDKYAAPLYGYCQWMLREPAAAADAVQAAFIIACAQLDALSEASQLRSWLYTVARDECYRRLSETGEAFGEIAGPDAQDDEAADPRVAAQRAEVRKVILATLGGLKPGDREVIELTLRHGLDDEELAAVLGVSLSRAHAHSTHARAQLERTLGALLIARTARQSCPDLGVLLAGWDGRLTVLTADLVRRHIDECVTCASRKHGGLRPEVLAGLLPLAVPPPGLREQVLRGWQEWVLRHASPAPDTLVDVLPPIPASWSAPPVESHEDLEDLETAGVGGLSGARLSGARLSGAGLSGAGLSGAGLSGAGLSGTGLSGWARIKRNPGRATTVAALSLWIVAAVSATLIAVTGLHTVRALASDTHSTGTTATVPAVSSSGSSSAAAGASSPGSAQPSAHPSADGLAPSSTPSESVSPSDKAAPSPSYSASSTASASASATASVSPSPSPTPVHTAKPTPTPTPTPTPSPTPSDTSS